MFIKLMVAHEPPQFTSPQSLSNGLCHVSEFFKLTAVRAPHGFDNHRATLLVEIFPGDSEKFNELTRMESRKEDYTSITAEWMPNIGAVNIRIVNADTTQAAVCILRGILSTVVAKV